MAKRQPKKSFTEIARDLAIPAICSLGGALTALYTFTTNIATKPELKDEIKEAREFVIESADNTKRELRSYSDHSRDEMLLKLEENRSETKVLSSKLDTLLERTDPRNRPRK